MATPPVDLKKAIAQNIATHSSRRMWRGGGLISFWLIGLPLAKMGGDPFDDIAGWGLTVMGAVGMVLAVVGAVFPEKK